MSNRFQTVISKFGTRVFFKAALMMGGLMALGYGINQIDFDGTFKALNFSDDPSAGPFNGRLGFVLMAGLITAVGGPRQVVSFFAAYFFGLTTGILLGLAGTALGCLTGFFFARIFRSQVVDLIRGRVGVAFGFWRQNTFSLTLIIRLLPIGSNLLTTLAAGATGIAFIPFFTGSVIGYVPQTAVFAMMGSGVNLGSGIQIGVSLILFVLSALLGFYLYARYRKSLTAPDTAAP